MGRHADGQALGDAVAFDALGDTLHRFIAAGDHRLVVGVDIGQVHRGFWTMDVGQQGFDS